MQIATTERTRLFVDGVPAAITADVTNRRDDGLVVTQALPFLRLATNVTGPDGQRSRISRVTIAMDGDVPKLLLELLHDGEIPGELPLTEDDTVETFTPGVSSRPARTDGTVPYEFHADDRPSREVRIGAPITEPRTVEPPPRLPAPEPPLWLRLWHGVSRLWAALSRRSPPLLIVSRDPRRPG